MWDDAYKRSIAANRKDSYFSFEPVFHDWCNKGRGMCYPVCGMRHIKEPLLLIAESYFSFRPVLHDWCNKGRRMCYSVCGMMHIKSPLLLIGKRAISRSSQCSTTGVTKAVVCVILAVGWCI